MITRPSGKDRHFIWLGEKAEGKLVRPYAAERFELNAQLREIERPRSLVNLNGVPSTKADRGASRRLEVRVFVPPTRATTGVFAGLADLTHNSAPNVNRRDPARGRNTDQDLGRLGTLHGCDDGCNRVQYSNRLTSRL